MVCVNSTACWVAYLLFGVVGLAATMSTIKAIQLKRWRLLLRLLPMLLVGAWLPTAFSPSGATAGPLFGTHAYAQPRMVIPKMALFVVAWLVSGFLYIEYKKSRPLEERTPSNL